LIFAILFSFVEINYAQKEYFDGEYSGEKLIIFNPYTLDYFGTCINRVRINGEIYPLNISDNYLEVDLKRAGVKQGDLFSILIEHELGCTPSIYNKNDFIVNDKVQFENLKVQNNTLTWNVKNNLLLSPILLEMKFRDKWVQIDAITSKGLGNQSYSYTLSFLLSGKNAYRILKPNVKNSFAYFSEYTNDINPITISTSSTSKYIYFIKNKQKTSTFFQLEDSHQVIVKESFGEKIDLTNLKSGFYTLYFDNKKEIILKK
jgi:hypothetical protein